MRLLFAILLFAFSANAAYQSTEIKKVVKLKVSGATIALRINWEVNDDFYPKVGTPPVSPINGVVVLKGANYTAFQAGNAAQKKALVWGIIKPDVQHFYRQQAQQPVQSEEDDPASPALITIPDAP